MGKEMFIGHIPSGIRPIIDAGILPDDGSPEWKRMVFVYQYPEMKIYYHAYLEIMWMEINQHPLAAEWRAWFDERFKGWKDDPCFVTLSPETEDYAASEDTEDDLSVTDENVCEVCGASMDKRRGAKTCSPKCRKKLSRFPAGNR